MANPTLAGHGPPSVVLAGLGTSPPADEIAVESLGAAADEIAVESLGAEGRRGPCLDLRQLV